MWVLKRECRPSAGEHLDWFLGCELGCCPETSVLGGTCSGARARGPAVLCPTGPWLCGRAAPLPRPLCALGALVPGAGRAGGSPVAVASCRLAKQDRDF